jgi:hypothetical protein
MRKKLTYHAVTPADLEAARKAFVANESRDLFYRAATELVRLALRKATSLTVAEALAVLLQTWNKARYQYRKFDDAHFARIEELLDEHRTALTAYRKRKIDSLTSTDQEGVSVTFQDFEVDLGPVGAAKTLHLLAPGLFPLWDRAIAKAYGLSFAKAGFNGKRYWEFMLLTRQQCDELRAQGHSCENPLKAIDEYNYCRYTKGWLP